MILNIKDLYKCLESKDIRENIEGAIDDVNRNIADESTHSTNGRKITIVIDIQPNDERDQATFDVAVRTTLARRIAAPRMVFLGKHQGLPIAENQPDLPGGKGKKGKE